MQAAAKSEHFEHAAKLQDTIAAIEAVTKPYRLKPDPKPLQRHLKIHLPIAKHLQALTCTLNLELQKRTLHKLKATMSSNTITNAAVSLVAG